jgi:hypothetical protein
MHRDMSTDKAPIIQLEFLIGNYILKPYKLVHISRIGIMIAPKEKLTAVQ